MKRIRSALLVVAALGAAGCATSPTGRDQLTLFSPAAMQDLGATAFEEIKAETPAAGAFLTRYVECVARPLVDVLPDGESQGWEIRVFDRDEANAFALPGGKIGVYKGLLDVTETQDQLATVIGHEIGHVLARHGNERMSSQVMVQTGMAAAAALTKSRESRERQTLMAALGLGTQVGILLPYSRSHETEADLMGLDLMARAGFDPRESVALWRNMARIGDGQPIEFLSTHPGHETRIRTLQAHMATAMDQYRQARAEGRAPDCDG